MLEKAQTEITHDACLGFFVTFIQRDEEERAGVRCNKVSISRPYLTKVFASSLRIHLRDTCGRQSFWIEPLGNCACEGRYDEMYQVVEEYLEGKGFSVQYDDQK